MKMDLSSQAGLEAGVIPDRCVLVSWIARNNDPYERKRDQSFQRDGGGELIPGPTLTLLFDPDSAYQERISDVVLFYREPIPPSSDNVEEERKLAEEVRNVLLERAPGLNIELRKWVYSDPTDHRALYEFLDEELPRIRKRYREQSLVIHISPGTPSMQTLWVLMAETGYIAQPFQLVKSYRKEERRGRSPVAPVQIGIPSLFKLLQEARPARVAAKEEQVWWDRQKFRSQRLIGVYEEARRFAKVKAPVLILGERGTGKTRLASWIRLNSPWRQADKDSSWPSVPCGQYTSELMRAELFGYKRGAFTGAFGDHDGMLARAHLDTLFLDEIGDITKDLQRLLIRAVEEQTYVRLGENTQKTSDFRLLTATNLPWEMLQEKIDPDFLDRISYFVLRLPALREIREDLPWLWEEVYVQVAGRSGVTARSNQFRPEQHAQIVTALKQHPLPGNLRDLFRVAYHLLAAVAPTDDTRMSRKDAVEYAIKRGLETGPAGSTDDIARAVCGAFARQVPLDAVLNSDKPLDLKQVNDGLRRYLATEFRRIAKERKVDVKEVCGLSLRALQKWAEEPRRDHSSDANEDSQSGHVLRSGSRLAELDEE